MVSPRVMMTEVKTERHGAVGEKSFSQHREKLGTGIELIMGERPSPVVTYALYRI